MTSSTTSSWIRRFHEVPGAPPLVCFPHAGGAATAFFALSCTLTPSLQVMAVQYPGRQDRMAEPALTTIQDLAAPVADGLMSERRPLRLFGHSMGALVAFEVARILRDRGAEPVALYVSGRKPPHLPDEEARPHHTDEELLAELTRLGGTDVEMLADDVLVSMVLPALRADYQALRHYRYQPAAALSCPVVALSGDRDPLVTVEQQLGWQTHSRGEFDLHVYPGGHFFLLDHVPEVGALLAGAA
ncbi:MAG: thioesterase II family protein [Phycicoccus sp.]